MATYMKYINCLLTLVGLFCSVKAIATTYYVDAYNGNDSWSGKTTSISATNGPWQSIARVNNAALQPGDKVLFSCGQVWYETLMPKANGSASAKIYFGSYPAQCTNKPKISGLRTVSYFNWKPYQGDIWQATFPQNLISNGSLAQSVANWGKSPSDSSQSFQYTCPLSVIGCMSFIPGKSVNNSVVYSSPFALIGGKKYTAKASIYVSIGSSAQLIVRENGRTFRPLGLVKKIVGNNAWQDVNVEFTATHTLKNARLDIAIPKDKQIFVRNVAVKESAALALPSMLIFNGNPVAIAHHPNAGFDSADPDSVYFRTTAASPVALNSSNQKVNTQIVTPNLMIPPGGSIGPGTKMKLRSVNWRINDFTVSGVGSGRLSITPGSYYLVTSAGWGFYFYNSLWMLDSPGEWFFSAAKQTLYFWSPASSNPGSNVLLATLDFGINVASKSNLTVENFEIEGANTGVSMQNATNITLHSLYIHNINSNAIFARQSVNPTFTANQMKRVALSGMAAINVHNSTNALIEDNQISDVGVVVSGGKRISLPMTQEYAILGGIGSIIANNTFTNIGGFAIHTDRDSDIDANVIENSCLNLNDCSAIYLANNSLRTKIRNNLILGVPADMTGVPVGMWRLTNAIYLDKGISGLSVTGNTTKGAGNSIHLHNSGQNTITGNKFYGPDNYSIWQQQDSMSADFITGNNIANNQFFPKTNKVSIQNAFTSSKSPDATKFAVYNSNKYSTIYSPETVRETNTINGASNSYTLKQWQAAVNSAGQPRNNDLNSVSAAPIPSFAQGTVGANYLVNGDFSTGLQNWGSWNPGTIITRRDLEGCLPVSINCMHVTAGSAVALVNSPSFSVTKGKYYRIAFDVKTSAANVTFNSKVQVAGPTKFTDLMSPVFKFTGNAAWKRYSYVFLAKETANSPSTANQGARFIIQGLPASNHLWVANLEIAPYNPGTLGAIRTDLLVNKTDIDTPVDCPTRNSNPTLCASYFIFPEATAAVWPISVPPRSGRIVFTQNLSLRDADDDGIADSQDKCPGTTKGLQVNRQGCSIND